MPGEEEEGRKRVWLELVPVPKMLNLAWQAPSCHLDLREAFLTTPVRVSAINLKRPQHARVILGV